MVKKKTYDEGIESPTVVSEPKVQNLRKINQETVTMRFQKKAVTKGRGIYEQLCEAIDKGLQGDAKAKD
ncbi:hypothetical protein Tco_1144429 [Tanacetum coccineum]